MSTSILGIGTAVPAVQLVQDEAVDLSTVISHLGEEHANKLRRIYRGSKIRTRHMAVLSGLSKSNGNGDADSHADSDTHNDTGGHLHQEAIRTGDDWNVPFYHRPTSDDDRGPLTGDRIEQYETHAADLAEIAATQVFEKTSIQPQQIDHLVTVSCTGFSAPGVDIAMFDRLDFRRNVRRTHVGFMGCHGVFNGLRVADAMVHRHGGTALICAVELCSVHFAYGHNLDKLIANSLFADGAGAVIVRKDDDASGPWTLRDSASRVLEGTQHLMTWRIGDHGFEMTLAASLPDVIRENLPGFLNEWLAQNDLSLADIQSWAVHPGGPRVLQAVQESLELTDDAMAASYNVLEHYGNMSSPTVLFILEQLKREEKTGPCVVLGFGPGLTIEAMLLD